MVKMSQIKKQRIEYNIISIRNIRIIYKSLILAQNEALHSVTGHHHTTVRLYYVVKYRISRQKCGDAMRKLYCVNSKVCSDHISRTLPLGMTQTL